MAAPAETLAQSGFLINIRSDSRIGFIREVQNNLIEANVDLDLLDTGNFPTDKDWIKQLASEFRDEEASGKESGQLVPILVGLVAGSDKLFVMDGLHRTATLQYVNEEDAKRGEPYVRRAFCVIKEGVTMEDVIDERIIHTSKHKAVKVARWAELVDQAWSLNPLSEHLESFDLFDPRFIYDLPSKDEMDITLTAEQEKAAREWGLAKLEKWGVQVKQFHTFLYAAAVMDTDLARSVRERDSRKERFTALPPEHFIVIAEELPGALNDQNLVAQQVIREQLGLKQTRALARVVNALTTAEAARLIESGEWKVKSGKRLNLPRPQSNAETNAQTEYEKLITNRNAQIEALKDEITDKDEIIKKLESKLSAKEAEVTDLETRNRELEDKISAMGDQLSDQGSEQGDDGFKSPPIAGAAVDVAEAAAESAVLPAAAEIFDVKSSGNGTVDIGGDDIAEGGKRKWNGSKAKPKSEKAKNPVLHPERKAEDFWEGRVVIRNDGRRGSVIRVEERDFGETKELIAMLDFGREEGMDSWAPTAQGVGIEYFDNKYHFEDEKPVPKK